MHPSPAARTSQILCVEVLGQRRPNPRNRLVTRRRNATKTAMSLLPLTRAARVVLTFVVLGACDAQLPPSFGPAAPPADAPWPLDVRPVSETCRALAKPAPPVAP